MAVVSCRLASFLLSAWLFAASTSLDSIEKVWTGTENDLYQSVYWEDHFGSMIIVQQDAGSQEKYLFLQELLSDTDVFFIQVSCGNEKTYGEICTALKQNKFGVKSDLSNDGNFRGVDIPTEYKDNEISFLLQAILGDRVSFISSYSELKAKTAQTDNLFLAYTQDTTNDDFVQLLKALLSYEIPLVVTTHVTTLPLSHHPPYTSKPSSLHVWSISHSGQQWLKFKDDSSKKTTAKEEHQRTFGEQLHDFVYRLQYPVVVEYSDDVDNLLRDGNFHLVYVFPGNVPSKRFDIEVMVQNVAKRNFNDFIFIVCKRGSEVARRLFVTDDKTKPQLVILPFGREEEMFSSEIETDDVSVETEQTMSLLDSILVESPRTPGSEGNYAPPLVSLIDAVFVKDIVNENEYDLLVAVCKQGSNDCPGVLYDSLRDAMVTMQRDEFKEQLSTLVSYCVECESLKDVEELGFTSLPSYGVYNHTEKKWYIMEGELTSPKLAIALVATATHLKELLKVQPSSQEVDYSSYEYLSSPLVEDDHFGLLLKTLPATHLPPEIVLTSDTFDSHIELFEKTVVVFYMSWCPRSQVFLHHVMAAHERLDKAQNASLAVVSCGDWTDICTRVGVTTFPTALFFTPSTLHTPSPLTHLDSVHILNALGQYPLESVKDDQVMELTPSTLPGLLSGNLATPLVVWCDSHVTSDKAEVFKRVALRSEGQSAVSYAWIDSSKYMEILLKMVKSDKMTFPTVVALQLDKHAVYQLPVQGSDDQFEGSLMTFIGELINGGLTPDAKLAQKEWPPLQPPVHFPSKLPDLDADSDQNPDGRGPSLEEKPDNRGHQYEATSPHQSTHTEL